MKKVYILGLLILLPCVVSAMEKELRVHTGKGEGGSYVSLEQVVRDKKTETKFELTKFEDGSELGLEIQDGTMRPLQNEIMRPLKELKKRQLLSLINNDQSVKNAIEMARSSGKCVVVRKDEKLES